nr:immunoglobulin heavy chain junction region [Macaca mulatta]MOW19193.1 immunoglobulin heavy chain junction region [Macaca mulatta]MOW19386.1 immunoglobulin heavy chain junction region [Macaca mulatta]MOW19551.1 immunoglobulin heavy chain junction region [Macaca mulatta]MOW19991.1 immunoglobulin heavy chain junction region [Macaca mulatta]
CARYEDDYAYYYKGDSENSYDLDSW